MAYSDDIVALNPDHHWILDGDSLDSQGSADATNSGGSFIANPISEDTSNCFQLDGINESLNLPDTTTINGAQTQFAFAGWFLVTSIQDPPKRIFGIGGTTNMQVLLGWGNTLMFEAANGSEATTLQVYGDVDLVPNRAYHLTLIFEGSGSANEVRA